MQTAIAEAYGDRLMEIWDKTNLDEEIAAGKSKAKLEQIHKSKALAVIAIEIEKAKKLALIAEGQKQMNSLRKEGIDKTLGAIDIEFKEQEKAIKEKYKDLFFLQAYLLKQLQNQRDEKIKNAKYDNEVKKVEDNARLQTAIVS